ncbi:MAG: hypothetical protein Q8T03_05335 [Bacteroidota bacterium]|nr:hypothetical protein [Bacteroidota bacterium]
MRIKQILFYIIFLSSFSAVYSQEKGTGPKEKSINSERKLQKKARLEAREKRRQERAERKAIKKHHKRIQTKKVRKRMKKSKKQAQLNHDNKREPFFKRLFKKKKRKK